MTYGIPAYKLPRDVVEAEIDILRELGVEIRCGVDVGKDVTLDSLRDEGFKAFYLADRCSKGADRSVSKGRCARGEQEHSRSCVRLLRPM